jgi:hypothetical protein
VFDNTLSGKTKLTEKRRNNEHPRYIHWPWYRIVSLAEKRRCTLIEFGYIFDAGIIIYTLIYTR